VAIIIVAFIVTAVIMIFVIPAFKEVFKSFGADLPTPTLIGDRHVGFRRRILVGTFWRHRRRDLRLLSIPGKDRKRCRSPSDRMFLRLPVFGDIIRKAVIARWTRTLATMFAAGVPLVESLESVGGAAGNYVYKAGTRKIQSEVSTGTSLTTAMQNTELFPNMVNQMVAIGEESGALDSMLGKVADFFEAEVDDAVEALASLMEPMIMVVLGVVIGGMVIAMYLPIFKLGAVVG
jgi:type IV pilus assembly protein PilC